MKYKKKYEVNIPIMFIIGVILLLWVISHFADGVSIIKNLTHIYSENVELSELKEGNYISVDRVRVLGEIDKEDSSYIAHEMVEVNPLENRYYMVNINDKDNKYVSMVINQKQFLELNDGYVNDDGYIKKSREYDIFNSSFDFKVVKADYLHKQNVYDARIDMDNYEKRPVADLYDKIALVPISFGNEKKEIIAVLVVFVCAVLSIIVSKPWKMITVEYVPQLEYNYVYKKQTDEKDERVISEEMRSLKLDIGYYERQYSAIKDKVKKNMVSFGLIVLIFIMIKQIVYDGYTQLMIINLGILNIIPYISFIKLLVNIANLLLNRDTQISRSAMSAFNKAPAMTEINMRKVRLAKCDRILQERWNSINNS